MSSSPKSVYALILEVRACFHRLAAEADRLHSDLGVTASMRAVLEAVSDAQDLTVPAIARSKGVSRQHIQVNADALIECGLLTTRDNPGHKRSPFVVLTSKGRKVFAEMRNREKVALEQLARALDEDELLSAIAAVRNLKEQASSMARKENDIDIT